MRFASLATDTHALIGSTVSAKSVLDKVRAPKPDAEHPRKGEQPTHSVLQALACTRNKNFIVDERSALSFRAITFNNLACYQQTTGYLSYQTRACEDTGSNPNPLSSAVLCLQAI